MTQRSPRQRAAYARQEQKAAAYYSGEFAPLQARFVYEGTGETEIKGEWTSVAYAVLNDIPLVPARGHRVIRLEFRDIRK